MVNVQHNFLNKNEFSLFKQCVENLGNDLYAPAGENNKTSRYTTNPAEKNVYAYSITATVPPGYKALTSDHSGLACLIDKIVIPKCNVVHTVSLQMSQTAMIPMHQDDSINEHIDSEIYLLPARVSILYLDIPQNMEGGMLCLRGAEQHIKPETNMLVEFDGDIWHQVTEITKCDAVRMMFVTEQYILSKRNYRKMLSYDTPKLLRG